MEPEYKKCKDELEELGLLKKEEDVISYAIYPEQAKKLLSGEAKPEFTSEDLPLKATITGRRFRVKLDDGEYEVGVRKV